jgi:hypothetical protein
MYAGGYVKPSNYKADRIDRRLAEHRTGKRKVVIAARERGGKRPCSTQELTMHVMAERGMNTADKRLVKTVGKRVGSCLRHHRNRGLIRSAKGLGDRIAWEVA